ncbi:hypothetical protein B0H13DRAFT_2261373 [Mycena leptocephala]|nr:hypothetical protein B0H13DRAFT_2261373 [Mycena leptocephala]
MSASQEFKAQEYLGGSSKLSNLPAVPALWTNKDWKPFQAEQIEDLNVDRRTSICLKKNSTSMVSTLPYNYHVLDHIGFHVELQEFGPISEDNLPLPCMPANQPTYIRSLSAKTSRSPFNRRRTNDHYYDGILYPTVSLEEPGKGYFNLTGHFSNADLGTRRTSLRHHSVRLGEIQIFVLANIPAFASSCIIIAYWFAAIFELWFSKRGDLAVTSKQTSKIRIPRIPATVATSGLPDILRIPGGQEKCSLLARDLTVSHLINFQLPLQRKSTTFANANQNWHFMRARGIERENTPVRAARTKNGLSAGLFAFFVTGFAPSKIQSVTRDRFEIENFGPCDA